MPQAPLAPTVRSKGPLEALVFALVTMLSLVVAAQPADAQTPSPSPSPSPTERADRPVLGILGLTAEGRGVTVARVLPDTGADEAGLQAGDLIVDFEGTRVLSMEDLAGAVERFNVGDQVTVTYERNGERRTAEAELGSSRERRRSPFEVIPQPDFGPDFEDRPEGRDAPSPTDSPDYRPVITLFGLLITGALIALAVILARRNRPPAEPAGPAPAFVPAGGADRANPPADPLADPLEVLRLRYAKGEISREEFLTMSADLDGAPRTPPGETPPSSSV